ncbi:unnamed protein product, partial [Amoebophrya sp. A120]|eukprot:GSA120T00021941001.1
MQPPEYEEILSAAHYFRDKVAPEVENLPWLKHGDAEIFPANTRHPDDPLGRGLPAQKINGLDSMKTFNDVIEPNISKLADLVITKKFPWYKQDAEVQKLVVTHYDPPP